MRLGKVCLSHGSRAAETVVGANCISVESGGKPFKSGHEVEGGGKTSLVSRHVDLCGSAAGAFPLNVPQVLYSTIPHTSLSSRAELKLRQSHGRCLLMSCRASPGIPASSLYLLSISYGMIGHDKTGYLRNLPFTRSFMGACRNGIKGFYCIIIIVLLLVFPCTKSC